MLGAVRFSSFRVAGYDGAALAVMIITPSPAALRLPRKRSARTVVRVSTIFRGICHLLAEAAPGVSSAPPEGREGFADLSPCQAPGTAPAGHFVYQLSFVHYLVARDTFSFRGSVLLRPKAAQQQLGYE